MTFLDRILSRPIYLAALVAIVALVVYMFTLAPGVDFIDAGELATDCWVLGICHPTGYPLFTLVGYLFSHLPIASSVILRMNIMAAFFTAAGAGGLVLLAYEIFSFWMPVRVKRVAIAKNAQKTKQTPRTKGAKNTKSAVQQPTHPVFQEESTDNRLAALAALATGLAAAFSATWWDQSTSIEVYPLHLFIVPMVLTFFLRMLRTEDGEKPGRYGKLFAVALGLSFANHMTTVLLAPACLYMFFARYGFAKLAWQRILRLSPFFIAALALYLYMPIRSAQYPIMDWGHPTTWGNFLRHVTGGQYKIWMFTGSASEQWKYFWHLAPNEFTIAGGLLAMTGIYAMFESAKSYRTRILIFTLLLFFGCLFYSINYGIHDIDSYFLLAFLAIAIWVGAGMQFVVKIAKVANPVLVLASAAVLLGGIEIGANFAEADKSGNHVVDDCTMNMLRNLPPNAIIFSMKWDFFVSGAFYYQIVEKVRPDVLVIDKAMLRDRPWYFAELAQRAPEVFRRVKPEENAFLSLLWRFDAGDKSVEQSIAPTYEQFTSALIERNLDRPIFITWDLTEEPDDLFAPRMKIVPAGLTYRLLARDSTLDVPIPNISWRDEHYRKRNYYTDYPRLLQGVPLANYAQTLLKRGQIDRAKQFLDAALKFKPDLGAKLDDLNERDSKIAEAANEEFTRIETLRRQLDAMQPPTNQHP